MRSSAQTALVEVVRPTGPVCTAFVLLALTAPTEACSRQTQPAALPPPPTATANANAPVAPTPPPPPPDLGMPLDAFLAGRTLERCALANGEAVPVARALGVARSHGQAVPDAAELAATGTTADAPAPLDPLAAEAWQATVALGEAHTPTAVRLDTATHDCLYAPAVGILTADLLERYQQAFVAIACLQRQLAGPDGKLDVVAHAHAAGKVFTEKGFKASGFARIGVALGNFPAVQSRIHAAKAESCPDPRIAEAARAGTGAFNGSLSGDRNATLQLTAAAGALTGGLQWLGATARKANGQPEQAALPLAGQVAGDTVSLFGQAGGDWARLEGKRLPTGLTGTWKAEFNFRKLKGTWRAERVEPTAAPGIATPTAP